jgi:small-conductance mechanosensitive channel
MAGTGHSVAARYDGAMESLLRALGTDLQVRWLGNPIADWAWALSIGILTFLALLLVRVQVTRRARRLAARDLPRGVRLLTQLVAQLKFFPLLALSMALASKYLTLPPRAETLTTDLIIVLLALQAGVWASTAVRFWLDEQRAVHALADGHAETPTITIVEFVARVLIWAVVLLVALDNLGVNIGALLAGLGIGGIAVALAVQNVLGDLLASLSIALDKPFQPGDAIQVDDIVGTVERVGIKSTRIRSASGEMVVMANADLLKSRVRNFGQAAERRKLFQVGVTYDTTPEQLRAVPELVRQAVVAHPGTRFERCHLRTFGDSALVFEVAFFSEAQGFEPLLEAEHAINLRLVESFRAAGIAFAFPTRTVILAGAGTGAA